MPGMSQVDFQGLLEAPNHTSISPSGPTVSVSKGWKRMLPSGMPYPLFLNGFSLGQEPFLEGDVPRGGGVRLHPLAKGNDRRGDLHK